MDAISPPAGLVMPKLVMPNLPVAAAARPALPADPAALWKTARDFEAMALGEFLKPMFGTIDSKKNPFGGGEGETTWRPMLVDEIAKQIAATGGLGLAGPVHDAMLRMQEGKS
jgi:flagellar protein FlgJ